MPHPIAIVRVHAACEEAAVERLAIDAQHLCGGRALLMTCLEDEHDVSALDLGECEELVGRERWGAVV